MNALLLAGDHCRRAADPRMLCTIAPSGVFGPGGSTDDPARRGAGNGATDRQAARELREDLPGAGGLLFCPRHPLRKSRFPTFAPWEAVIARPSPELLDTVYLCQQRQDWYREFARVEREGSRPFVGSASVGSDIEATAGHMRRLLGFGHDERRRLPTWSAALRRFGYATCWPRHGRIERARARAAGPRPHGSHRRRGQSSRFRIFCNSWMSRTSCGRPLARFMASRSSMDATEKVRSPMETCMGRAGVVRTRRCG